ncbi:MAG: hypothetical protein ACE5OZ_06710 [Candidatus Heimdallarchaeota archaeon]
MKGIRKIYSIMLAFAFLTFLIIGLSSGPIRSGESFKLQYDEGDTFFYEINGLQISNNTDLKHNGTMFFTVLMRNSTHIRVKEVKHEIVSGFRENKAVYTEFHPTSYALIDIRTRTLVPFEISVWHWIDPTSSRVGENFSIVGESMTLVEKTTWQGGKVNRSALRFFAQSALLQNENKFTQSWYDCYYDANYGFPLMFSTHFHQWKLVASDETRKMPTLELANRTISRSDYFLAFVETNATFLQPQTKCETKSTSLSLNFGITMLALVMSHSIRKFWSGPRTD